MILGELFSLDCTTALLKMVNGGQRIRAAEPVRGHAEPAT
jgi:hypothetical protein